MRMAVLENDHLRVVIALDRGAEIVEFRSKSDGLDPLLHLPGGPRDPRATTPSIGSVGGSFLDFYAGGWQEVLPNGGPTATHRGAEYGQHGEVALVPWTLDVLEDDPQRVSVRCRVRGSRTPFLLERRMTIRDDRPALFLDERLTNEAGEDLDLMWGHHVAFGRPFLDTGVRIWTSARVESAPRTRWPASTHAASRRGMAGVGRSWPRPTGASSTSASSRTRPRPRDARCAICRTSGTQRGMPSPRRTAASRCAGTATCSGTCGCGRSSPPAVGTPGGSGSTRSRSSPGRATRRSGFPKRCAGARSSSWRPAQASRRAWWP